jgi:hypothetical protein
MKTVYISRNYKKINSAGGKARTDVEIILKEYGFQNIGLEQTNVKNNVFDFIINLIGIFKALISMPKNDILFLQYPIKKYYTLICKVAHIKNTKVITLIHDLGSFRRKKLNIEQEISRLNHSDCLIPANDNMICWLKENGYRKPMIPQMVWDYLSEAKNSSTYEKKEQFVINYIGSLSKKKNSFLYEYERFISFYDFHLYGSDFDISKIKQHTNIVWKGFKSSEELISSIKGDWGLVWDGDSIYTCSGDFGSYLQYNNPHKMSLYLRCHIPVIIWQKAGLTDFVKSNNIGICIDSLEDLDKALCNITNKQYLEMKNNVRILSEKLAKGYFLRKAINEAITSIT